MVPEGQLVLRGTPDGVYDDTVSPHRLPCMKQAERGPWPGHRLGTEGLCALRALPYVKLKPATTRREAQPRSCFSSAGSSGCSRRRTGSHVAEPFEGYRAFRSYR